MIRWQDGGTLYELAGRVALIITSGDLCTPVPGRHERVNELGHGALIG